MAVYFVDTSGLMKRYPNETGSAWMKTQADPASGNLINLSRLTRAEVVSAMARKHREGHITLAERDTALATFRWDCLHEYRFTDVGQTAVDRACDLLLRYTLRAYDALQLASALLLNEELRANRLPELTFVSADDRLCRVAAAEGLAVENPNAHP